MVMNLDTSPGMEILKKNHLGLENLSMIKELSEHCDRQVSGDKQRCTP